MQSVKVGDHVVFADQQGRHQNAIVICVFGKNSWDEESDFGPTINVLFADQNPEREDSYGRQSKRETSVPHKGGSTAHGYWWALPSEL